MSAHPSRFELASSLAGECSADEERTLRAHVDACTQCQQVLADIEANRAAFDENQAAHFAALKERIESSVPEVIQFPSHRWSNKATALLAASGLAAAAAAVLLIVLLPGPGPIEQPDAGVAYKGAVSLRVHAKRGEHQFKVEPDSKLTAGDVLTFSLTASEPGFLSLFTLDAAKTISPLYPETDPKDHPGAQRSGQAGDIALPGGAELDDTPGAETIVLVFAASDFDRNEVHARALEALASQQDRQGTLDLQPGAGLTAKLVWLRFDKVAP